MYLAKKTPSIPPSSIHLSQSFKKEAAKGLMDDRKLNAELKVVQ